MKDLQSVLVEMCKQPIFSKVAEPTIDMRGWDGSSPLHSAAWFNDVDAATLILAAGADINAKDNDGQTSLQIAIESGYPDMACLLVQHGAITADEGIDQAALQLLLGPNRDGRLDALSALLLKMWDLPEFMGLRPTQPNVVGSSGDTPLHVAVIWEDIQAVRLLLSAGADVNVRGDQGYTPLHKACFYKDDDIVELLVSSGADLFAEARGDLPFTVARLCRHDHLCDLLGKHMESAREADPHAPVKSRIRHLKRELKELEMWLEANSGKT